MSYVHISGWVQVTEPNGPSGPVDPGFGRPGGGWSPVDPGWGQRPPVDPGFGVGSGLRPDNSLPWAPVHPGNKPPGRPILPPHADNGLPPGAPVHVWIPGHWEILDPGFGKPPLLGFIPVDPGFGIPETPPNEIGGGPITPGGGGGQWVPTDPDYGIPNRPCPGGKPHPPIWAWIPTPPDLSKPVPPPTMQPL